MINFITRYFTSLWAFITSPFRALWRSIVHFFPPREFTVMDTPRGNVYTFRQSSFWRFTKFCGKIGLFVWAAWSTYVFVYHRPLLQKRTQELEEATATHARHISDLQSYLEKYNALTKELNVIDDKVLNTKDLDDKKKEELMNSRIKTWAELDFLRTRIAEIFTDEHTPEYTKLSELSIEYELTRAENAELHRRNTQIMEMMAAVSDADTQIIDLVSKMSTENIETLRENIKRINSTIATLGLSQNALIKRANKYSNPLVGTAFNPLEIDKELDPKYQELADNLELWHGLSRINTILPLGAPVEKVRVTSNYGNRSDPFTGKPSRHRGIDFAGKIGTELLAVAPGRVISAGDRVGYGTTVEIDHGLGFTTLYAHLSQITVARGDWVRPGTVVGLGGSSGRSTGPHLHYEIRYKGAPFDPTKFVKEK